MNVRFGTHQKLNNAKRRSTANGWRVTGRAGRRILAILLLVSSMLGMSGFTAVQGNFEPAEPPADTTLVTLPDEAPEAPEAPIPPEQLPDGPGEQPAPTAQPLPTEEPIPTAEPEPEPTPEVEPLPYEEESEETKEEPEKEEPEEEQPEEISVELHIIAAPDAQEECFSFTVPAGSSLDLLINDAALYSLCGNASSAVYTADSADTAEIPDTADEAEESAAWEWYTLTEDGVKLPYDLSAPVTEPLVLYAALTAAKTVISEKTVVFYAAVNGEWVERSSIKTSDAASFNGAMRYYVTLETLESVYSAFGFSSAVFAGERFFPHTDNDANQRNNLWADVLPQQDVNGGWLIPLGDVGKTKVDTFYVYYLPHNSADYASYFTESRELTDAQLIADNNFYTVNVDGSGKVAGQAYKYTYYVPAGVKYFVELPALSDENASWVVHDGNGSALDASKYTLLADDASGGALLMLNGVDCPVNITAQGDDFTIIYNAGITPVTVGQFAPTAQSIVTDGTVNGLTEYIAAVPKSSAHRVLATDSDRASVLITNNGKSRPIYYTFRHWKIDGTEETVLPGKTLDAETLAQYAADGDTVTLSAVWSPFEKTASGQDAINTVNFYVSYDCEILSNNGLEIPTEAKHYTPSIFSTRVNGVLTDDSVDVNGTFYIIKEPSRENAAATDTQIRNCVRTPVKGLTLEEMPTDEAVLSKLRAGVETGAYNITLAGTNIAPRYLTSEHFTIRWFVFKYEHSDGYHVDGVLVAKAARLVVQKTFTGSTGVIEKVKAQDFKINVTHASASEAAGNETPAEVPDYTLVLKAEGDETLDGNETGYTRHDVVTDTYTWVLAGYQNQEYTVRETGCGLPEEYTEYSYTARCIVRNPNRQTVTAGAGWTSYDEKNGVSVVVASYANDIDDSAVQTVALENMYVRTGTITVAKRDSVTGHGIGGVGFVLTANDLPEGTEFRLFHKPQSSQYSAEQNDVYTDLVKDNTVTTGGNGYFYLKLGGGHSYTLTERLPLGYNGAQSVTFTVGTDGKIETVSETNIKDADGNEIKLPDKSWAVVSEDKTMLSIDNLSHALTEVTVHNIWNGAPADEEKPVTVQLWRSGVPLTGDEYTQELTGTPDETGGKWTYTWKNLPLFVDGRLAEYSVRVTYIGDVAYDANIPDVKDGYEDYDVTLDENLYKKGADSEYGNQPYWTKDGETEYADHVLIRVNIEPVAGKLSLRKVSDNVNGKPLIGAEFTLYSDAGCTDVIEKAVSGAGGEAEFTSKLAAGTYYLKETGTLRGYALDDTLYRVRVHAGIATVTADGGDGTAVRTVVNVTDQTLKIAKVNRSGSPVTGAEFTLVHIGDFDEGETIRAPSVCTVGVDGTAEIPNLGRGKYMLIESGAPNGYKALESEFEFVAANGEIYLPAGYTAPDGWKLTGDRGSGYTLTVTNEVLYVFPAAGGVGIYVPIALGSVMMCASAVLRLRPKRKKRTAH